MNDLGAIDTTSGPDDLDRFRRDDHDELSSMRDREATLSAAYKQDPGDLDTMAALVRVQQAIRKREEDSSRLADNSLPSQSADEQIKNYGVRLPTPSSVTAMLDTPVSHLSTHAEVQGEIDAITRTIGFAARVSPLFAQNVDPRLITRLNELNQRLTQVDAAERTPPAPGYLNLSPYHAPPTAQTGNAAQIAAMHVNLAAALHPGTFATAPEVALYANQYIAFTAKHPELRELHDRAVADLPRLVDEATARDQQRAQGEQLAHDRAAMLQVRAPLGVEQMVPVGALSLMTAQTVHAIAGLIPVAGELQAGLEALSGHEMWGIGEQKIEGVDRLLTAVTVVCGLASYARKILNGSEAAQDVARVARESGKSEDEVRGALQAAVRLDNEKARVKAALNKAKAGEEIGEAEHAAIDRVRAAFVARDGITAGDLVRTARGEAPRKVIENPTGSWGGPGTWIHQPEYMSPSAAAYQERVTGVRAGTHAYEVDGAHFDGLRIGADGKVTLLDAKDRYAQFLQKDGSPVWFMQWEEKMLNGLREKAKIAAAHGAVFEVRCSESAVAERLRKDFLDDSAPILVVDDGAP